MHDAGLPISADPLVQVWTPGFRNFLNFGKGGAGARVGIRRSCSRCNWLCDRVAIVAGCTIPTPARLEMAAHLTYKRSEVVPERARIPPRAASRIGMLYTGIFGM